MKKTLIRCTFVLGGLIPMVAVSPSSAAMFFEFRPTPSGGVSVVGFGGGFADRNPNVSASNWDVQDFTSNFLKNIPSIPTIEIFAGSVAGTFKNVTTNITENIISFDVDRDPPAGSDDLEFDTANTLVFSLGDEFLFQMTATFNPGTLKYSDLVPGTHIDVGHTLGGGIADESFGITTLTVVPEPATLGLLLTSIVSLGAAGRRKRRG